MKKDEITSLEVDVQHKITQADQFIQKVDEVIHSETNELYRKELLGILNFVHKFLLDFLLPNLQNDEDPFEINSDDEWIIELKEFSQIEKLKTFMTTISHPPYSTIQFYLDLNQFIKNITSPLKNPEFIARKALLITKILEYQSSLNQPQIIDPSLIAFWNRIRPILQEGMIAIYWYSTYLNSVSQILNKTKYQDEFQKNPALLEPVIDLVKTIEDPRWYFYTLTDETKEFKQLLEKSLLTNQDIHEKILQTYNPIMIRQNENIFQFKDTLTKNAKITINYVKIQNNLNDLDSESNLIGWIKVFPQVKSILSLCVTKLQTNDLSEEEYQEDIQLKFELLKNYFELLRYFFFFLHDLYTNSTRTLNLQVFSKGYEWRGFRYSVTDAFRKLQRNRTFRSEYPALFDQITKLYKKIYTFRITSAHYSAVLDQNLYQQKEVRYIKNRKKKTIPYKDFSEIVDVTSKWFDNFEKIYNFHKSHISTILFINSLSDG